MTSLGPPPYLDLAPYDLDFDEDFAGTELDRARWLPYYLPQWSSREATGARYQVSDGRLQLRIDPDQAPWSTEFDGATRVSSLQTGVFSGPLGSPLGQHQFTRGLIVREEQPTTRLFTPRFGVVEIRAAATDDPDVLVALWMIGFEDDPIRSGEICVMEIFGRDVGVDTAAIGMGVHPFGDPSLTDDFSADTFRMDARQMHRYAVRWTPDDVGFYIDRRLVKMVHQSPQYPMQLMLNIYDVGGADVGGAEHGRKHFVVDYVRGYRPRPGC